MSGAPLWADPAFGKANRMQASDVMTADVITVRSDIPVAEVARILLERRISAVPVTDDSGQVMGIVSEGDLMRRPESDTIAHRSWWLGLLTAPKDEARRYLKTYGRHARDVMSREVITVHGDAPLDEIATILEEHHIKRVPVLDRSGRLVGIVSRADLLRGLAIAEPGPTPSASDRELRTAVAAAVRDHTGSDDIYIGVGVRDGVVHLWGGVEEPLHKDAARVAAENVPGVRGVENRIRVFPPDLHPML